MKKSFFLRAALIATIIWTVSGCYDEPLQLKDGADCGGCEDPGSGGTGGVLEPKCKIADLAITQVMFYSINTVQMNVNFTVKNIGGTTAQLANMRYDIYFSADDVFSTNDTYVTGSDFIGFTLTPGTEFIQYVTTGVTKLKYIIVNISVRPGYSLPECLTTNNRAIKEIPVDLPRNGLVAFYQFNGNGNDETINHNDGFVSGPILSTDRFGGAAKSYYFDGVNDFITVGNPPSLRISNEITLSGWINADAFSGGQVGQTAGFILSKQEQGQNGPVNGYRLSLGYSGLGTSASLQVISTVNGNFISGVSSYVGQVPFPAQQWLFFCIVIDDTNLKYYENGILKNEFNHANPILQFGDQGNLHFGSLNPGFWYKGRLDDIAIYNRPLSEAEVIQVYRQTISR